MRKTSNTEPTLTETDSPEISMDLDQADKPADVTENEINELESFDLQTNLLNPEAFEGNQKDAEITDIASNGNNTLVVRTIEGSPQIQFYQESGLVNLSERIPLGNITYKDIVSALHKSNTGYAYFGSQNPSLANIIKQKLDPNISTDESDKIMAQLKWAINQTTDYFSTASLEEAIQNRRIVEKPVVKQKPLNVKLSPDGDQFIITYGEELVIMRTREKGKNLPPEKWQRKIYGNRAKFNNDQGKAVQIGDDIDEYYAFEDKSRLLKDIGVVATFGENEILTLVDKESRTNYFRAGARDFDYDPSDKKTVFFVKSEGTNTIGSIDASQTKTKKWKMSERAVDGINGKILELKFDPNGNFLNVIYETDGKAGEKIRKLAIIEKDTLKVAKEYNDAHAHLEVDPTGTIYFEDKNHQLRAVTTNFSSFPEGGLEAARVAQLEQLKKLQERIGNLSIEDIKVEKGKKRGVKTGELKEDALKETLATKVTQLFEEDIKKASTLEEVAEIDDRINALKNEPDFLKYPDVFTPIEMSVSDKGNSIKAGSLEGLIGNLEQHATSAASFEDALALEKEIAEVTTIRQAVSIKDIAKRRALDSKLSALQKRTQEIRQEHVGELMQKIEGDLNTINDIIAEAQSPEELRDTLDSAQYQSVEKLINSVGERETQKALREKLRQAVTAQRSTIDVKTQQHEQKERMRMAEVIVESDGILAEISERIDAEVTDVKELEKWQRANSLITKYTSTIIALPKDLRKEAEGKFDALIRQKRGNLEYLKTFKVSEKNGNEVQFGKEKFPRFQEAQVVWSAKVEAQSQWSSPDSEGHLIFEDNRGRTFRPKVGTVPMDINNPVTKGVINLCAEDARKYFEQFKRKVPNFSDTWDLNDFYQGKLEEMAKLLRIQKEQQKGALILEGEAGTGKNVLFDMFAHFTNREVFMFSCNMQSEKEDITYAFRFDPERGTYQVESRVLEALKTPGALLIFDEINSLPKGVAKMLNPLLDYRRELFFPEGKASLKADPSVLIAGTENPQYYLGVSPLSQEVKSRARFIKMGYPPETRKEGGKTLFAAYEGRVLAKYVTSLKDLRSDEVQLLWDYHINGDAANGGDKFTSKQREKDIKALRTIVQTANTIREAYDAFRTGKSNDVIEFVFSLRETIDIASEMDSTADVKKAIKNVVLPKISDPAESERIETIIDNV